MNDLVPIAHESLDKFQFILPPKIMNDSSSCIFFTFNFSTEFAFETRQIQNMTIFRQLTQLNSSLMIENMIGRTEDVWRICLRH